MQINRFKTVRAHGHLTVDVRFRKDLTFLTGINGSGKTTVVRGVIALLSPAFRDLANTNYELMEVHVEHADSEVRVSATRTPDDFTIRVSGYEEIVVPVFKPREYEPPARFAERQSEFYREQHTLLAKHPGLEYLKSLPTPLFLDLERRGGGVIHRPRFLDSREAERSGPTWPQGWLGEGLREAQALAEETNQTFEVKRRELTEELRKGLILMAFGVDDRDVSDENPFAIEKGDHSKTYATVTATLRSLGISADEIARQVDPFFARLTESVTQMSNLEPATTSQISKKAVEVIRRYAALHPQIRQIERMVRRADTYDNAVKSAHTKVENYLEIVNQFLRHSGKTLMFSARGQLRVRRRDDSLVAISALSSGEKQLVVILTHLALNPKGGAANALIIDEPELSLHIRWQEMFVDALRAANQRMQYIFATHSPSIIMERTEMCVDLPAQ